MKKSSVYVFMLILFCCRISYLAAQETAYPPDVEERIRLVESNLSGTLGDTVKWALKDRMALYNIHGLSIAVVNNYTIEWSKAYGLADTSDNRPVTTETLFQAGSVSKSLNAVGVLKLVEDNKLDLYTDINNYLTTWKFPYDSISNNKKITLANLLSHTAGLSVYGFLGYNVIDSLPDIYQILDGKSPANNVPVRSQSEPGLKYSYSGGGIMISQLIVMDTTHLPYDIYMKQNVLNPLGMDSSFYTQPPPDYKKQLMATGYYERSQVDGKYHIYPEQAAAGLWTNPTELCKYIIETQLAYKGKSNKVLSQETTKLRLTPYIDNTSALGMFVYNNGMETYFYHAGKDEGFITYIIGGLDGGYGFAVMFNLNNSGILTEIFNSIATVYQWKGYYQTSGIKDLPNAIVINLYPNPAGDFITLNFEHKNGLIQIFSPLGIKVFETEFKDKIDVSHLSPGIYLLKAGNKFYKFVKL